MRTRRLIKAMAVILAFVAVAPACVQDDISDSDGPSDQ